jgi:hypothetical protein
MTEKNTTATPAASNGVIQTAVVENTHLSFSETGFANGYVGVPEKHPWFAKNYDDISCDCHGGLTYSENHLPNQRPDGVW